MPEDLAAALRHLRPGKSPGLDSIFLFVEMEYGLFCGGVRL